MIEHLCHARGCRTPVPPRRAMCLRHWRLVPVVLQKRLWAAYVPGQETRKDPTPGYLAALRACVEAVATAGRGPLFSSKAVDACTLVRAEDGSPVSNLFATKGDS